MRSGEVCLRVFVVLACGFARCFHDSSTVAIRTLLALIRLQNFLSQPQRLWRDLHELVVGDEFDGLLQIQRAEGNQANCFIGGGCAHVGQLLLAHGVHIEIGIFRILADDHAFIEIDARADEQLSALLQTPQCIGGGNSAAIGDQRARQPVRNLALPLRCIRQRVRSSRWCRACR